MAQLDQLDPRATASLACHEGCRLLNKCSPQVSFPASQGSVANWRVGGANWRTPVRMQMAVHDKMAGHDGCASWLFTMAVHDGCARWLCKMVVHDGCSRWLFTMAVHDGSCSNIHRSTTQSVCQGTKRAARRGQWLVEKAWRAQPQT